MNAKTPKRQEQKEEKETMLTFLFSLHLNLASWRLGVRPIF
jgi:hypothetical protein